MLRPLLIEEKYSRVCKKNSSLKKQKQKNDIKNRLIIDVCN